MVVEDIQASLLYIFEYLKFQMIEELQRQGHNVTGKLIESIDKEINFGTDYVQLDGSFIYYGKFVDTGRRAGGKKVPIAALEDWIRAKGFERDAKKVKGMAFAIQTNIWKKGISTSQSWAGERTKDWMTKTLNTNDEFITTELNKSIGVAFDLAIDNLLQEVVSKSKGTVTIN